MTIIFSIENPVCKDSYKVNAAQWGSQVTPDIGVCKNPYRQLSPKRKLTYVALSPRPFRYGKSKVAHAVLSAFLRYFVRRLWSTAATMHTYLTLCRGGYYYVLRISETVCALRSLSIAEGSTTNNILPTPRRWQRQDIPPRAGRATRRAPPFLSHCTLSAAHSSRGSGFICDAEEGGGDHWGGYACCATPPCYTAMLPLPL